MKYSSVFLVAILFSFGLFMGPVHVDAATSISTCAALQNIGSTGLNGDYVLSDNIDCSGIANFAPVGTFTGTLDGQGYTISNFSISRFGNSYIGLFSATDGAVIRNLSITNANVSGGTHVGVLVGSATNTVITNVAVSSGTTMFGQNNTGGLVGSASNTRISYSHTSIPMNVAYSYIGGLVGYANTGTIISKSYSTGQVSGGTLGGTNIGGLVGLNDSSTIVDSYSTSYMGGGIFWTTSVGGLVGVNNGATALIDRSYSTGGFNINGTIGGLVETQSNGASTTNSFWDTTSSGTGSSAGGTGRNTGQMQTEGTFVSGWDFTNVWVIGGYPTFRVADVTAPAAPTSFTAVATGANVHLAWTNPGGDFASVYVRRSSTVSPSSVLAGTAILSASALSAYDNNSLADGTYYYSVIALDTNGNYSIPARATVLVDTTPPSAPTSFTAVQSGSAINLAWTNPGGDFASVTIRRNTGTYPTNITDGLSVVSGLTGTTRSDTGLADGAYYYSIFALDATGNVSTAAQATATLDTVLPVLAVVTSITTPGADTTPNFSFSTTKAGTIAYGGSCASGTTSATIGTNTVTFNALADGTYSNCTVRVTDSLANASLLLSVGTFIIDTTAPTLAAVTSVASVTAAADALYVFTATESGSYSLSGCVGSVSSGSVRFTSLLNGTYSCTLSLLDGAGNVSNTLAIGPFTIVNPSFIRIASVSAASGTSGAALGFEVSGIEATATGSKANLLLNANPATVQGFAVSLKPDFSDAGIMPYQSTTSISIPDSAGVYTIYLKYYSTTGDPSSVITRTIVHKGSSTGIAQQKNQITVPVSAMNLKRNLQSGMSGSDVKWVQQFMNTQGFTVSSSGAGSIGRETNYFGPKMEKAVIQYQKTRSISPTGGVGPLTRAAIAADLLQN